MSDGTERIVLQDANDEEIRAIIISCFQELARRDDVPMTEVIRECLDEIERFLASGEV